MEEIEYHFPAGKDVIEWKENDKFYADSKMQVRKLNRNGFCSYCTRVIHKNNDNVLTFKDDHSHGALVLLCRDCVDRVIKLSKEFE